MANTLTADDPRYREMFDAAKEAAAHGAVIEGDLTERMSALRNTAPVMKGSLRQLLGVQALHEVAFDVLLVMVVFHVAAIAYYLLFRRDNLIGPMVTGSRDVHAAGRQEGRHYSMRRSPQRGCQRNRQPTDSRPRREFHKRHSRSAQEDTRRRSTPVQVDAI
jgi:hypothetical protein